MEQKQKEIYKFSPSKFLFTSLILSISLSLGLFTGALYIILPLQNRYQSYLKGIQLSSQVNQLVQTDTFNQNNDLTQQLLNQNDFGLNFPGVWNITAAHTFQNGIDPETSRAITFQEFSNKSILSFDQNQSFINVSTFSEWYLFNSAGSKYLQAESNYTVQYQLSNNDNDFNQNFKFAGIKSTNLTQLINQMNSTLQSNYIINTNQIKLNQKPQHKIFNYFYTLNDIYPDTNQYFYYYLETIGNYLIEFETFKNITIYKDIKLPHNQNNPSEDILEGVTYINYTSQKFVLMPTINQFNQNCTENCFFDSTSILQNMNLSNISCTIIVEKYSGIIISISFQSIIQSSSVFVYKYNFQLHNQLQLFQQMILNEQSYMYNSFWTFYATVTLLSFFCFFLLLSIIFGRRLCFYRTLKLHLLVKNKIYVDIEKNHETQILKQQEKRKQKDKKKELIKIKESVQNVPTQNVSNDIENSDQKSVLYEEIEQIKLPEKITEYQNISLPLQESQIQQTSRIKVEKQVNKKFKINNLKLIRAERKNDEIILGKKLNNDEKKIKIKLKVNSKKEENSKFDIYKLDRSHELSMQFDPQPNYQNSYFISDSNQRTQNDEDVPVTDTLLDHNEANNFYQELDSSFSLINQQISSKISQVSNFKIKSAGQSPFKKVQKFGAKNYQFSGLKQQNKQITQSLLKPKLNHTLDLDQSDFLQYYPNISNFNETIRNLERNEDEDFMKMSKILQKKYGQSLKPFKRFQVQIKDKLGDVKASSTFLSDEIYNNKSLNKSEIQKQQDLTILKILELKYQSEQIQEMQNEDEMIDQ